MSIERFRLSVTRGDCDPAGEWMRYSDHASELAEWKQRAERAEAYVAGQDEWSTFSTAEEMHAELVRVRTQRESICLAFNKALKANALLRAECEAAREFEQFILDEEPGPSVSEVNEWMKKHNLAHAKKVSARAATDAAGILKGGE